MSIDMRKVLRAHNIAVVSQIGKYCVHNITKFYDTEIVGLCGLHLLTQGKRPFALCQPMSVALRFRRTILLRATRPAPGLKCYLLLMYTAASTLMHHAAGSLNRSDTEGGATMSICLHFGITTSVSVFPPAKVPAITVRLGAGSLKLTLGHTSSGHALRR
eukprot:COSAG02_NODE_4296_length_5538_cov_5.914690_2_plen_160_part_00